MRFLLLFLIPTFLLTSCEEEKVIDSPSENIELVDNFKISGSIENAKNMTLNLVALSQQGEINVAKTALDASGNFVMKGNIPGFGLYQLHLGDSDLLVIPLTLVPDDELTINTKIEEFVTNPSVEGADWTKSMNKYMQLFAELFNGQKELYRLKDSLPQEELTKRFLVLKTNVDNYCINEIRINPGNPFNIVLQNSIMPAKGFNDWDPKNLELLEAMSVAYQEKFPNSPITSNLTNQVYQIEMMYQQHVANNTGTRTAPEIALNTPDGIELRLSSLKGKYVLIDFWASWCGPCRRENPNVVRLYNKYKDMGFTVFSVSLDDNIEAWKAAIEKDKLIWPNHVSDLKKWDSPLPQLYGFNGIPYTVLINKEGNIIGVGLRGESLEQKLQEIFKK